jgi:hypothetical protein
VSDYILPERLDLLALCNVLQHDLRFLLIVQLIVLVIADLFKEETIARG